MWKYLLIYFDLVDGMCEHSLFWQGLFQMFCNKMKKKKCTIIGIEWKTNHATKCQPSHINYFYKDKPPINLYCIREHESKGEKQNMCFRSWWTKWVHIYLSFGALLDLTKDSHFWSGRWEFRINCGCNVFSMTNKPLGNARLHFRFKYDSLIDFFF